jgi:hypothetical protein
MNLGVKHMTMRNEIAAARKDLTVMYWKMLRKEYESKKF